MTAGAVRPLKCGNCGFAQKYSKQLPGEKPAYCKSHEGWFCAACREHLGCNKLGHEIVDTAPRGDYQGAVPPNDGIYSSIDEAVYHGDLESLSSSGARALLSTTPEEFDWNRRNDRGVNKNFDYGHVTHKMVLGKGNALALLDPKVCGHDAKGNVAKQPQSTSEWKAAEALARRQGKIPVPKWDMEKAQTMAGRVFQHRVAGRLLSKGQAEHSVYWHDDATGIRLRCRPDFLTEGLGRPICVDYKGLALDTPIPTPTGWSTMGALSVGDEVFASDGSVCRVTGKSEVHLKDCYRMTFDDATSIVCDHDHLWATRSGITDPQDAVLTTEQIARTLRVKWTADRAPGRQHRIAVAGALRLPPAQLPIDPYVLGAWLGDGSTSDGKLTSGDAEQFDLIEARGYRCSAPHGSSDRAPTCTVYGLRVRLREIGLLGHKTIPDLYMRSSILQRLDLLRGLMDTDGSWNALRNMAVFTSMDKALAVSVRELALSLGERAVLHTVNGTGFGKSFVCWRVTWNPQNYNPFELTRKRSAVPVGSSIRSRQRIITACDRTITVPTQCITVDSADSTYLCGEQMVPTHNTATSANPKQFQRAVQDYGYHCQQAFYEDGLRELGLEDVGFLFVVQSKTAPFTVSVCSIDPADVELGRRQNRAAIDLYARCTESGRWPGYDGIQQVSLAGWATKAIEESLEAFYQPTK